MERYIYHSAEGSTWTKKNHKYIRKEGNRYIYPEDVKKFQRNVNPKSKPKIISRNPTASMLGKGTVRLTTGDGHYKDINVDRNPNEYRNAYKEVLYSTTYSNNKQHKRPGHESSNGYGTGLSGEYSKAIEERNRQQAMVNEKKAQAEKARYSQANRGGMKQKKREDMIFNAGGQYKDDRARLSEGFEKGINYKVDKGEAKRLYRSINDPKRIADKEAYGFDVPDRFIGPTDKAKEIKTKKAQEFERKFAANGHGAKNQEYAKRATLERQQAQNRKAAANGQVVNPIATWRGSNGQVIAREKTNEKISSPTTADYKKYGQLRGGATNRSKAMNNQGSTDYKQISKQQSRKKVLNSQGSSNRQQEAKDFKEYQDWEKADNKKVKASKEYYDELRSNTRNEKEFNDYLDEHNIARPDGSKPTASKSKKVETWDNSKNIETFDNSKNIKTWDDVDKAIDKKSTNGQKGTFTLGEDGQTKFVPESENKPKKKSNKALEKGKAVIDSIRKRIKKKDKKK